MRKEQDPWDLLLLRHTQIHSGVHNLIIMILIMQLKPYMYMYPGMCGVCNQYFSTRG